MQMGVKMKFGIGNGEGTKNGQTGRIRGRQQEVACECWFTSTGKMMPLMLKIKDEDGVCRTIRPIFVRSYEKKMFAGTPFIEFDCEITVGQRRRDVRLIYYQNENRWKLNVR